MLFVFGLRLVLQRYRGQHLPAKPAATAAASVTTMMLSVEAWVWDTVFRLPIC